MPKLYPQMTRAKLKKAARKTSEGKGRVPLPGVKTDAKDINATDQCGYKAMGFKRHDREQQFI